MGYYTKAADAWVSNTRLTSVSKEAESSTPIIVQYEQTPSRTQMRHN